MKSVIFNSVAVMGVLLCLLPIPVTIYCFVIFSSLLIVCRIDRNIFIKIIVCIYSIRVLYGIYVVEKSAFDLYGYGPPVVCDTMDISYIEIMANHRYQLLSAFPPIDPFSGRHMKKHDGVYYSVGPDGKDDKGEITYDPTNGTFSRGDICLIIKQ
jgi:hypothetical protein